MLRRFDLEYQNVFATTSRAIFDDLEKLGLSVVVLCKTVTVIDALVQLAGITQNRTLELGLNVEDGRLRVVAELAYFNEAALAAEYRMMTLNGISGGSCEVEDAEEPGKVVVSLTVWF